MSSDVDRAWGAGFFDGEGCFSLNGNRAIATISQNNREVLDRFQGIVACGAVYGPQRGNPQTRQQPFFVWRIGARADFDHVVAALWPWLGTIKREAASRVAMGAGPGGNAQSRKTHCPQNHAYDEGNTRWVRGKNGLHSCRQCRTCQRHRQRRNQEALP